MIVRCLDEGCPSPVGQTRVRERCARARSTVRGRAFSTAGVTSNPRIQTVPPATVSYLAIDGSASSLSLRGPIAEVSPVITDHPASWSTSGSEVNVPFSWSAHSVGQPIQCWMVVIAYVNMCHGCGCQWLRNGDGGHAMHRRIFIRLIQRSSSYEYFRHWTQLVHERPCELLNEDIEYLLSPRKIELLLCPH